MPIMDQFAAPPIVVPTDEVERQATAALQGYAYQLYQTVSAWLSLAPGELLHIEFAEDFATSDPEHLALTQVNRTRATMADRVAAARVAAVPAADRAAAAGPSLRNFCSTPMARRQTRLRRARRSRPAIPLAHSMARWGMS
jgi:hypothetical protein